MTRGLGYSGGGGEGDADRRCLLNESGEENNFFYKGQRIGICRGK